MPLLHFCCVLSCFYASCCLLCFDCADWTESTSVSSVILNVAHRHIWIVLNWIIWAVAPLFINRADLVSRRKNLIGTTYLRMSALYFFHYVLFINQLCCDFKLLQWKNCKSIILFFYCHCQSKSQFFSWISPEYLHVLLQGHSATGLSTPMSDNLGGLYNDNGFKVYVESQFLHFNSAQSSAHVLSPICFLQTTEDKELFVFAKLANRWMIYLRTHGWETHIDALSVLPKTSI